jgi:hypothetical protein
MAKKTELVTKSTATPASNRTTYVDPRIAAGMFFTLTGTILAAFGLSTRDRTDVYIRSLGIDANLWWGLALLIFGIVLLAFGRRGQAKMEEGQIAAPANTELRRPR